MRNSSASPRLPSDSPGGDALDKTALENQKDDQQWNDADDRSGHLHVVNSPSIGPNHRADDQGQSETVLLRQNNQRPQEAVPRVHEKDHAEAGQTGRNNRQNDAPVNGELGSAVDTRRVE